MMGDHSDHSYLSTVEGQADPPAAQIDNPASNMASREDIIMNRIAGLDATLHYACGFL